MNVDFTKYKRFFAFGCSFTCYIWPTWADVVSKEMPQAKFYNLGKTGAGNLCISSKVAEANNRFKFTDKVRCNEKIIKWVIYRLAFAIRVKLQH
jgi:hypothetical protein